MLIDLSNKLESTNIFEEFFNSQVDRGYLPGKYNVYFYRYIGCTNDKEYDNNLAYLDKELKKIPDSYLLFTNSIPVPFDQQLTFSIMNELLKMDINCLENEDVNLIADLNLNTRIKKALGVVVPLAIQNEKFMNQNIMCNFITKIMIWCNQFLNGNKVKWDDDHTPKCVFYGELKRHEAYFLILLSLIGFDVLYINSLEDNIMGDIDRDNKYSNSLHNPIREPVQDYKIRVSRGEVVPVVTTVAQKANKEIEEAVFNNETGIFKPWQFVDGTTHAVLINSTVDEVGIYWEQASKLRPGFKVEKKTVYVPNFFAKINGVNSDITEYYTLISKLRHSKNTIFTDKVGLIEPTWSKPQMFSLAFIMDGLGRVIAEELKKHELYRFSSLKEEVQMFLINKINELLETPSMVLSQLDSKKRLQIVATVLSMPGQYLNLIESFDYTGQIPKLVIYLSDKVDFSEEDTILMAFLNRIGFDIVILSPCSANNIEKSIASTYITNHRLEEVVFDLELRDVSIKHKKSFFEKLFG